MADSIGNVAVPEVAPNGVFPLISDFGFGYARAPELAVFRFGSRNSKTEQRFLLGNGARRFTFVRQYLTDDDRDTLKNFFELRSGPYEPFTYNAPNDDGTTTAYTVRFADPRVSWDFVSQFAVNLQLDMLEVPDAAAAPVYALNSTETRFPGAALEAALLDQVQQIIPLVKLQPRESGYPAIYVSDRRCTVGGQLYQARLIDWDGIQQAMGEEADQAVFVFGNADRVMRSLANDTDLMRARVEFSLFHVGTAIKLDLWAGDVIDWQFDSGPEFRMTAADGLYELTLPYPTRRMSRTCWKDFADGVNCPYVGAEVTCDKSWAACQVRSMEDYFGGIEVRPQAVYLKDNSTGHWGYGRSPLTAVSQMSDSIYNQILPQVWTDSAMPVNAKIAAGREESEFYDALGIVSEGPIHQISGYPMDHRLDGQPPHGPGNLGMRRSNGHDPVQDNDPDSESDEFSLGEGNPTTYSGEKAAGVAFLELRRSDEKGRQLTRLDEHSMVVTVTGGMGGWTWIGGVRQAWSPTLTNPVWIAINCLLRAKSMLYAADAAQQALFDVTAAEVAATTCNLNVAKLIGAGNETQFKFKGVLQEEKPLRDWIAEILACCLGYYTFSFGKLKIGVRINSSVIEAFTEGNIIFQSLQLAPLKPSFNHLTGLFADEEFEFQPNTITLYDIDHAKLIGSSAAPLFLKSQTQFVGVSGKSQCARLVTTRLREELGGITYAEWKAARQVAFKTTVLALNTDPGMVCSMTHDDMPGGAGEFRVTSWRLNKDYSIDIQGRTTTDSMYDLTVGDKPADVTADPVPVELYAVPRGLVWAAFQEQPDAADPMWDENDWKFALTQTYETLADGTSQAILRVTGRVPINQYVANAAAPQIRTVTTADVGGTILGGHTYYVAVCARTADGTLSPPSNIMQVDVPAATNTNTITITDITWPSGVWLGYNVFCGMDYQELLCDQGGVDAVLPASCSLILAIARSTWTFPSPFFRHLRMKAKRILHSGVLGYPIDSVGAGTITIDDFADPADDYTGRTISVISDASDGSAAIWNFHVDAYNVATGEFTCTPDPQAAGVEAGDPLIVRYQADTHTALTLGDSKAINHLYPAGMTVDAEVGYLIRIIAGTGRGQVRRIASNTATVYTVDAPFDPVPDATSIYVVEMPEWEAVADSTLVRNGKWDVIQGFDIPVSNYLHETMLVVPVLVDNVGNESDEDKSPVREIYLYGQAGVYIKDFYARIKDTSDPLETGTYQAQTPYRVRCDVGTHVELVDVTGELLEGTSGGAVTVDILRSNDGGTSWDSIFGAGNELSIPDGSVRGTASTFAIAFLERDDLIQYSILSVGGTTPGSGLEACIKGRVITT